MYNDLIVAGAQPRPESCGALMQICGGECRELANLGSGHITQSHLKDLRTLLPRRHGNAGMKQLRRERQLRCASTLTGRIFMRRCLGRAEDCWRRWTVLHSYSTQVVYCRIREYALRWCERRSIRFLLSMVWFHVSGAKYPPGPR